MLSEEQELPKGVNRQYSVKRVMKLRRKLRQVLGPNFVDKTLDPPIFDSLVDSLRQWLPKGILRHVIVESIDGLVGTVLSAQQFDAMAWRLAGNLVLLLRGDSVPPWTVQPYKEWVPAQIISAKRRKTKRHKPAYLFTLAVLAGRAAGLTMSRMWTDNFCRVAAREFGFCGRMPSPHAKQEPHGLFNHPLELVNMRLSALVDPALCDANGPGFEKTTISSAAIAWNKEIIRHRDRLQPAYACPFKLPLELLCHNCHKGTASCCAAVHLVDYTRGWCKTCKNSDAVFDPVISRETCLRCYNHMILTRKD